MHICKKILLFDTTTKLAIYIFCITVLSVVTDMFPFPRTYFSNKRNALNMIFVKWGWGWTCTILGMFIYFTRCVGMPPSYYVLQYKTLCSCNIMLFKVI